VTEDPHGAPPQGGWLPPESPGGAPGPAQQPPQWGPPQSPYGYGSPWASTYYYAHREPDNSPGMAGFILSLVSIGVLLIFVGFSAPLTICLSIAAVVVSRNGINKVKRGETRKHKDLATWGFWLGIVGIVLSLLAAAGWIALFVAAPDAFEDDYEYDEDGDPVRVPALAARAFARAAGALLG
jgi:hypothetical protein